MKETDPITQTFSTFNHIAAPAKAILISTYYFISTTQYQHRQVDLFHDSLAHKRRVDFVCLRDAASVWDRDTRFVHSVKTKDEAFNILTLFFFIKTGKLSICRVSTSVRFIVLRLLPHRVFNCGNGAIHVGWYTPSTYIQNKSMVYTVVSCKYR